MLKATSKVGQCSESLAEAGQSRLLEDDPAGLAPTNASEMGAEQRLEGRAKRPVYSISRMTQMARVSICRTWPDPDWPLSCQHSEKASTRFTSLISSYRIFSSAPTTTISRKRFRLRRTRCPARRQPLEPAQRVAPRATGGHLRRVSPENRGAVSSRKPRSCLSAAPVSG